MALQILGRKSHKNIKKSSLYSQCLLIFIHKTPVVERHPTKREIREYYGQGRHRGNHGLFLHEQLAHLNTGNTQKKVSNIPSDEDIMENNYLFGMLWNLSVIGHWIFRNCFFVISGAKSKDNLRGYVAFYWNTIKNVLVCNFMILNY